MPKLNKKELYSLVVNSLTEGDSFIAPINNWNKRPYIGGLVSLEVVKYYFSLELYNQYGIDKYEIHKYKGTVPASNKWTCN